MKIQILWADPRERRFGSGDIFGDAEIASLGLNIDEMLSAREIQILEADAPRRGRPPKSKGDVE